MKKDAKASENGWFPFLDIRVSRWADAIELFDNLTMPLFRGQANSAWPLEPVLHRAVRRSDLDLTHTPAVERSILREFKRRAHHHLPMPPDLEQELEWLAIIQHYGGPTRLLDFTRSPYVAAFFALETADGEAAVWSIAEGVVQAYSALRLGFGTSPDRQTQANELATLALKGKVLSKGVLVVEPFRLNERMALQQGTFVLPLDVSDSFAMNLTWTLGDQVDFDGHAIETYSPGDNDQNTRVGKAAVAKIRLPKEIHSHAMRDLGFMNVTAASLFGGIDGLARSFLREVAMVDYNEKVWSKVKAFRAEHGRLPNIGEIR